MPGLPRPVVGVALQKQLLMTSVRGLGAIRRGAHCRTLAALLKKACPAAQGLIAGRVFVRPSVVIVRCAATRTGRGDVEGAAEQIDETQFHDLADAVLTRLHDTLDAADLDDVDDISLEDGVFSVKFTEGGAFVINKHFATRQIWYASPISGALYFSAGSGGCWISEARGETLEQVFTADLVKACPAAAGISFGSSE
mmetsp:Transcript_152224/g.386793  ORF Transcript_152224/g.386793 Transcript_152224/m.386793 type:complete len:197 (-) Transcript_152224:70-660(-)